MTNEEKEAAMTAEHIDFNERYEDLLKEAESLAYLSDYYFKPDSDIERKTGKLRDFIVSEAAYMSMVGNITPPV